MVVILMMVATVALIGLLIHWAAEYDPPKGWQTPRAGTTSHLSTDGDFVVYVVDVDTEVWVSWNEYRLYDINGKTIEKGKVMEIYELNINVTGTNVTFCDRDRDGQISSGDRFIIRSIENGGPAQAGQEFVVWNHVTEGTMFREILGAGGATEPQIPHLDWQLVSMDSGNISLDMEQSATSHALPFAHTEVSFLLDLNYTGSEERTLKLLFKKDGELLAEEEYEVNHNDSVGFQTTVEIEHIPVDKRARFAPLLYGTFSIDVVDTGTNESLLSTQLLLESWPEKSTPSPSFSSIFFLNITAVSCVSLASGLRFLRKSWPHPCNLTRKHKA